MLQVLYIFVFIFVVLTGFYLMICDCWNGTTRADGTPAQYYTCDNCRGEGKVEISPYISSRGHIYDDCVSCGGSGHHYY